MTFDLNFCGKIIWYKISIIMKKKRFELTVTNNTIFVIYRVKVTPNMIIGCDNVLAVTLFLNLFQRSVINTLLSTQNT